MRTALSRSPAPTVRLPDDTSTRRIEALHELAWRDLLDLQPGTTQALIDRAASQLELAAAGLAAGARVGFHGACGSDLFVVCDTCSCDRAVIEVKGPGARMNLGKTSWQTDLYRDAYRSRDSVQGCPCVQPPTPLFILLDAQNRTREEIERKEGANWPLSLSGWAVLTYGEVLSNAPFAGQPLADWLLGY
jgi:hypothetical protein